MSECERERECVCVNEREVKKLFVFIQPMSLKIHSVHPCQKYKIIYKCMANMDTNISHTNL